MNEKFNDYWSCVVKSMDRLQALIDDDEVRKYEDICIKLKKNLELLKEVNANNWEIYHGY